MRILVDTGVFGASISRRRRARFETHVGLMAGHQIFLAAVTVAELRMTPSLLAGETNGASGWSSRLLRPRLCRSATHCPRR
ncbi:MAG TPA: hypothetical protein VFZ72_01725 [Jiangellaceae bacterium]